MEPRLLIALATGWLISGPVFHTIFRRLGLRFRVRPSLPTGPRIPDPREGPEPSTSLPSRSGAVRPVRPPTERRPRADPHPPASPIWWDDVLGDGPDPAPEAGAD